MTNNERRARVWRLSTTTIENGDKVCMAIGEHDTCDEYEFLRGSGYVKVIAIEDLRPLIDALKFYAEHHIFAKFGTKAREALNLLPDEIVGGE